MTTATADRLAPASSAARLVERLAAVPLWAWWLTAIAASTVLAVYAKGADRIFEFIDSDDALRFIHVRELLAGAPWFETKTHALGGQAGLVSHWSRLIDGPMTLLLGSLQLVLPEDAARQALMTVWPMLMLAAVMWAIARATLQAHGRAAAHFALAVAALSLLTYYQFAPGRLDHHNAMIASAVSAALLIWAWPERAQAWRAAGALCGLALAIGYEALAPVCVLSLLACGWALLDRRLAGHAASFTVGLVAAVTVALVVTVPPTRWLTIHCDALSANLVVLAGLAGGGFVLVMSYGGAWSWPRQVAGVAVPAAAGIALFGWLEPACLAGPMGQVPSAVGPIWLNAVEEAKSLFAELLRGQLSGTVAPITILVVGLAMGASSLARSGRQADRFLLAASAMFVALALWQMKFMAYASFILVPGLALAIKDLPAIGEIRAPTVRISATFLLNQLVLFALVTSFANAAIVRWEKPGAVQAGAPPADYMACMRTDSLRVLGAVPPGLVITHTDLGAHLPVVTPLRALSGPYHRIPDAIIANHAILAARDHVTAGRELARQGADYVLSCRPLDTALSQLPDWQGTLVADLAAVDLAPDRVPAYLVAVPLTDARLFRMWRVDRSRLPQP